MSIPCVRKGPGAVARQCSNPSTRNLQGKQRMSHLCQETLKKYNNSAANTTFLCPPVTAGGLTCTSVQTPTAFIGILQLQPEDLSAYPAMLQDPPDGWQDPPDPPGPIRWVQEGSSTENYPHLSPQPPGTADSTDRSQKKLKN